MGFHIKKYYCHRYIINFSFGVIANSKYTLNVNYELYNVNNKNSIVIYNGVEKLNNLNTFKKEDDFIITQIGIGIGVKNTDYFLKLNLTCKNIKLRLVGNAGSEKNFNDLLYLTKENKNIEIHK